MTQQNQNSSELPQNKPQLGYTASTLLLAPLSSLYVSVRCPNYQGLMEDASSSRPKYIPGETNNFTYQPSNELFSPHFSSYIEKKQMPIEKLLKNDRAEKIRKLRGKYAHVRTSSEDFARRKIEEIELEGNA